MPYAPVARLKKAEIVWLSNHRCRHGHTYLDHYNCFLNESPKDAPLLNKIGFFDIETHNLKASIGTLFGYCILDDKTDKIYQDWLKPEDFTLGEEPNEKRVIENMVKDLRRFDVIVTYFGTRFDFPYARTKALMNDIPFPEYGELVHQDLYYMVKSKLSLHRNSLDVACETVLGHSEKTRVTPKDWIKALHGNAQALKYISDHCIIDVDLTKQLYHKIIPFRKRLDRSA